MTPEQQESFRKFLKIGTRRTPREVSPGSAGADCGMKIARMEAFRGPRRGRS
jgi:hypothetical protein